MSISKGWLGLAALAAAGFQVSALAQSAANHDFSYNGEVGKMIN
jgi:hypothetical protein